MVVTAHQLEPTAHGASGGLAALAEVASETGSAELLSEIQAFARRIAEQRVQERRLSAFELTDARNVIAPLGDASRKCQDLREQLRRSRF